MRKVTMTPEEKVARLAQARAWWAANPEKTRGYQRKRVYTDEQKARKKITSEAWYRANPEKVRWKVLKVTAKKIGIDIDKLPPKPELCPTCGLAGKMSLDHCHISNKFRGWICCHCNSALGMARDNPETLRNLIAYLERQK